MAGHPFAPVTHKFLTYFFSNNKIEYSNGIPIKYFIKKREYDIKKYSHFTEFDNLNDVFSISYGVAGQVSEKNTIFSYAKDRQELELFTKISGKAVYKGREGIEFYPQELFLLEIDDELSSAENIVIVKNFQNTKSKYKIPSESFPLEKKKFISIIKGIDIERFHLVKSNFIVPFPYENSRNPISVKELTRKSKLLAKYFNKFKEVFDAQTNYNAKIIGEKYNTEFYALARVGDYSFAKYFVAFRDNTKWQACVVSLIQTPWGEFKRPQFQNRAVTITQDNNGNFITLEEAHYICAIINAPLTKSYILSSSDSRSFKIDPPIYIPKFDSNNLVHKQLAQLSVLAHKVYDNREKMIEIDNELNGLIIKLKSES